MANSALAMRAESVAMANKLLAHHRHACIRSDGQLPQRDDCTLTYGDLCSRAGVPYLTRNPGPFLLEVAHWCQARGWPPINALAVNGETGVPGDNYNLAPGCSLLQWPNEVDTVIAFRGYSEAVG
jgi:hypothetical protein